MSRPPSVPRNSPTTTTSLASLSFTKKLSASCVRSVLPALQHGKYASVYAVIVYRRVSSSSSLQIWRLAGKAEGRLREYRRRCELFARCSSFFPSLSIFLICSALPSFDSLFPQGGATRKSVRSFDINNSMYLYSTQVRCTWGTKKKKKREIRHRRRRSRVHASHAFINLNSARHPLFLRYISPSFFLRVGNLPNLVFGASTSEHHTWSFSK